jgi:crotonobetainyl-CoA:carnitine CoA-transferase CaiB-like acyl-CoA transferase
MANQSDEFSGLRVLEFAQGVAAPYCGMLLARHGATVTKVEPTGDGDWSRALGKRYGHFSANALVANRGKRSIAIDLKTSDGLAIAHKLAANADVIVENYRPGVIERFKLDYDSIVKENPTVVYASLTGFGSVGPNKNLPATDTVMQGYSGLMSINRDAEGRPRRLDMLAVDTAAGLYLFQAISAALYKRATKGTGTRISTSLLHCALAFQEVKMLEFAVSGAHDEPLGAPVNTYKTSDGFLSLNARRPSHFVSLCDMLGKDWAGDPKFSTPQARIVHAGELDAHLIPILATKTTAEWSNLLTKADILHAPVKNYGDLFEDAQVKAIQAIGWQHKDEVGKFPSVVVPGFDAAEDFAQAPDVGEHSDQVLSEMGYNAGDIAALRQTKAIG